jgi:hypothetical protein
LFWRKARTEPTDMNAPDITRENAINWRRVTAVFELAD